MQQSEYEWMYELEDTHWWFVSRQQLVNTLLEQQLTPDSNRFMLDVGCGTGGNLKLLGRWGNTIGIDLNPVALNYARCRNLPRLAQASGLALPYPNNVFGLVTAFDVLYHCWITDDCQAIEECYRVLQPGGWLLLTDPALPGLWSTHDEIYYTRERYLLSDIRQKLADAGFELVSGGTDNHLMLVDLMSLGITGAEAEKALDEAGITVNKNVVPYEKRSPFETSGVRIGTPSVTSRGMKEQEMSLIAAMILTS